MHTVFQLIDFEGNKVIGEEELAELMRTMGKNPRKAKIRTLIEDIKPKKKGEITENEFVDFMIEKRRAKGGFKPEAVEEPRRGRSPTKASSPRKTSASPKRPATRTAKSPTKRSTSPKKKPAPKKATTTKKSTSPKKASNIRRAGNASTPAAASTVPTPAAPVDTVVQKPKNDLLRFYSTTAHTKNYGLGRDQAFCDFNILVSFSLVYNIIQLCY